MVIMNKNKYVIDEKTKGERLDKAVVILDKDISRMAAQRMLDEKSITVNRKFTKSFI